MTVIAKGFVGGAVLGVVALITIAVFDFLRPILLIVVMAPWFLGIDAMPISLLFWLAFVFVILPAILGAIGSSLILGFRRIRTWDE